MILGVRACTALSGIMTLTRRPHRMPEPCGWLSPEGYRPCQAIALRPSQITPQTDTFDQDHPFFGAGIVFTGTLQSMVRRDAMQHVVNLGGYCPTTVTQDTNFLVVGDQDFRKFTDGISSSKMKKAQRLRAAGSDIELISEDDFLRMLEPVIFAV